VILLLNSCGIRLAIMKSIFHVKNMHCSNCSIILESLEDELPGIISIFASYHKQQLEVEYDERFLSADAIIQAGKQKGYDLELSNKK
jgi:copper chaperone CopZ